MKEKDHQNKLLQSLQLPMLGGMSQGQPHQREKVSYKRHRQTYRKQRTSYRKLCQTYSKQRKETRKELLNKKQRKKAKN